MDFSVRASEHALHKAHVGVQKRQPQCLAGLGVGLRHHPADVGEAHKTVHIGDGDRLRIRRIQHVWGEHMESAAETRRPTRYRHRSERLPPFRDPRLDQPGAERPPNTAVPATLRPN
jgi:hypothetical protein